MGFSADSALPKMAYNFDRWGDGQDHEIPEPSNDQLATFWSDIYDINHQGSKTLEHGVAPEGETPDQEDARLVLLRTERELATLELQRARAAAYAAVCSNQPSTDEILATPARIQNAFMVYVRGELNPEG